MKGNELRTGEKIENRAWPSGSGVVEISDGRPVVVDATDAAEHRTDTTDLRVHLVEPFLGAVQSTAKVKIPKFFNLSD